MYGYMVLIEVQTVLKFIVVVLVIFDIFFLDSQLSPGDNTLKILEFKHKL